MTAKDIPPVPAYGPSTTEPQVATADYTDSPAGAPKRPISVFALIAFILGVTLTVTLTMVKTVAVAVSSANDTEVLGTIFGWLGLVSIVVVAATVILGHLGIRATRPAGKRGRALAVAGVTLGYLHLVLYFNRVLIAIIALFTVKDSSFVWNIFGWA
jgi:hypothetical protein